VADITVTVEDEGVKNPAELLKGRKKQDDSVQ
jgi:hypothetical protein